VSYQVSWQSGSWRRSWTDVVVTSSAPYSSIFRTKMQTVCRTAVLWGTGRKRGCEDSSLLGRDLESFVDYLPLFGWTLLSLSFSWLSHFTGNRTNPLSVCSEFLNSDDMWKRCTVGMCVVYYFPKLMFFFSYFVTPVSTCFFVIFFISLHFPTSWSIQFNVQALMVNSEIEAVHIYYYVISVFEKPPISFLYLALFRLHNTTFLPSD